MDQNMRVKESGVREVSEGRCKSWEKIDSNPAVF